MLTFLKRTLSSDRIEAIEQRAAGSEGPEAAWEAIAPLVRVQRHQYAAARCLARIVSKRYLSIEHGLDVLAQVDDAYGSDAAMLAEIGNAMEGARDIDDLNAAPPEHPLFESIVVRLSAHATAFRGHELEERILDGLATAARMVTSY